MKISVMKNYINREIDRLSSKNYDCIYCLCDIDTIPLETFLNVDSIDESEKIEGNMVWVEHPEYDTNYYIYVNGDWLPALMTSDEELYNIVMCEVREYKIDTLID